jgi:O-antigen/teichoic acid export membrane protein
VQGATSRVSYASADSRRTAIGTFALLAVVVAVVVATDFVAMAIASAIAPDGPWWTYVVIQALLLTPVMLLARSWRRRHSRND